MIYKRILFSLLLFSGLVILLDQALYIKFYKLRDHLLFAPKQHPVFRIYPGQGALIRSDAKDQLGYLMNHFERKFHMHSDYILDADGMRQSEEIKKMNRPTTINVFGDSFTFGLFLKENQTFIHYLNQESKRCKFINYGVPGFSLLEMINLSFDTNIVKPADHHLFIFITDDIVRILRRREVHHFGRKVDFATLKKEIMPELESVGMPASDLLLRSSFIFRTLYEQSLMKIRHQLDLEKMFIGLQNYLKRSTKQDSYSFIHLPSKKAYSDDPQLPPSIMKISLLSGKNKSEANDLLEYFFVEDNHPNAAGARWIADEIKKRWQEMCF